MPFTPGSLIDAPYQVEYGASIDDDVNRAIVLGSGANSTEIVSLSLWDGVAQRSSDIDRPLDDGQFPGEDFAGGRAIVVEFEVWGADEEDLAANWIKALSVTKTQRSNQSLALRVPGWPDDLLVYARPRRRSGMAYKTETAAGFLAGGAVQFWATDPRVYGATLRSESSSVSVSSGGLTFDATADFIFGLTGTTGVIDATNTGNTHTSPVFTINGPVTNPTIENQSSSKILEFTGAVGDGQTLDIDVRAKTILLNGTSSRYTWLDDPTGWFLLEPGSNDIVFRGTTSGTPTLQVQWRDAWL